MPNYNDPCSFSNPQLFVIKHIGLKWNVNFDTKTFNGSCNIDFELTSTTPANASDFIILDTRDLKIFEVKEASSNTSLDFSLEAPHQCFGQAFKISLKNLANISSLKILKLNISYETSSDASALQWLDANLTLGKKHPYLFSQCQAIHARSILPCQDTPAVKFTYDASVTVCKPLTILMSACPTGSVEVDSKYNEYKFEQKIKIPSYLLAICAGNLVSKQIGPISKVWSEVEMIDKAAYEFQEVGEMMKDAESVMGKYVWGTYDLLVLPPSFPYGGMENPCLTFVTPTIIAGDRSLVTVIQHEITHSWTGNLVTNCSWEHFWLNEGFTRFIERKLIGLYNKSELHRQFECIDGWRALAEEVEVFREKSHLTKLVVDLKDTDPDDAFSSIPYEKGNFLLFHLEEILGGPEVFNKYLKAYIEKFQGQSIDTDQWKAYLYEYFSDQKSILDKVDWQGWLYTPGMPPVTLKFDETIANKVNQLALKIFNEDIFEADPLFNEFNSNQKRELLSQLLDKEPLPVKKLEALDHFYKFGISENSEILFRWIRLGVKAKWTDIIPLGLKFVSSQGRMKFTRPVYRDLFNWESAKQKTIENFKTQREFMHKTTASLVAKDLLLI